MTKVDFEFFADFFVRWNLDGNHELEEDACQWFEKKNKNFDRDKFFERMERTRNAV